MSGEINAISNALGRLQESAEAAERSRLAMWGEIKGFRGEQSEMRADLAQVLALKGRVDAMEPHVEDWKQTKQRGIGILAVVGLASGGVGAAVVAWLRKMGVLP